MRPRLEAAVSALSEPTLLGGLVELYPETWCVLLFVLRQQTLGQAAGSLPSTCTCAEAQEEAKEQVAQGAQVTAEEAMGGTEEVEEAMEEEEEEADEATDEYGHAHETHSVPAHDWQSLPPRIIAKIDALTQVSLTHSLCHSRGTPSLSLQQPGPQPRPRPLACSPSRLLALFRPRPRALDLTLGAHPRPHSLAYMNPH